MSLDGGAPSGGGGGAPAAAPASAPSQPAPARTPQQASDALDARVAAKRHAAEQNTPRDEAAPAAPSPSDGRQRGPDGKFLPKGPVHPSTISDESKTKAATASPHGDDAEASEPSETSPKAEAKPQPDPEHEKLKGEHAKATERVKALEQRDSEWIALGEKAFARIETLTQRAAQLEAMLRERGVETDPRDIELATFREREKARALAEERAQQEAQARAQAEQEAAREQRRASLVSETRAAMAEHPEVFAVPANAVEVARLVLRSNLDPRSAVQVVAAKMAKQQPVPQAPRTLSNMGGGGATPKLTDPRDIADKWKARLRAV